MDGAPCILLVGVVDHCLMVQWLMLGGFGFYFFAGREGVVA
jgi:hypothetical protein